MPDQATHGSGPPDTGTGAARVLPATPLIWTCGVLVGVAAVALRFLLFDFTNDDLLFLAIGRQIAVFHDWPVRDLFEEGDPLHNVISATLQAITGHALIGEALFDIAMFAVAAAVITVTAARLLRSATAGTLAGVLPVMAWPRLYDYPKALVPAVAMALCVAYARAPALSSAIGLGALTGVAFLLRHDFGAYTAIAAIAAIAAAVGWRGAPAGRHLLAAALAALVFVLPYACFVQAHVGVRSYFEASTRFTDREVSRSSDAPPSVHVDWSQPWWTRSTSMPVKVRWAAGVDATRRAAAERRYHLTDGRVDQGRTWAYSLSEVSIANQVALVRDPLVDDTAGIDRWLARAPTPGETPITQSTSPDFAIAPGILTRDNAVAWLYALYTRGPWLIAIAVLVVTVRTRRLTDVATVLPPVLVCLASSPLLLRGNLSENSRLADFTVPAVWLGVSVCAVLRHVRASRRVRVLRWAAAAVVAITVVATGAYSRILSSVDRIGLLARHRQLVAEPMSMWRTLVATPPALDVVRQESGARGAVDYLRRCTRQTDRVLVFGFFPEMIFYSGRPAAADRVVLLRGFGTDPADERHTLAAMLKHPPVLAIVEATPGGGSPAGLMLDGLHPLLEHELSSAYRRVATTAFGGSSGVLFDVWVNNTVDTTGPRLFDVPCLRPAAVS